MSVVPSAVPLAAVSATAAMIADGGAAATVGQLLAALEAQTRLAQQLATSLAALGFRLDLRPDGGPLPEAATRERAVGAPPAARVAVYCFGTFSLLVDGKPVDTWRSGKTRALLQYLATHHDRPVPRETLIAELWPNPDAAAAGTSLKVAIHALRQALVRLSPALSGGHGQADGDDAGERVPPVPPVPPVAPLLTIMAHEAGYQLSAADLWLDVEEFERCCVAGRRLERQGRVADALGAYARAADLYAGDFLGDSWDDWVVFRREGLKDQYLFVVARLADAALVDEDFQGCIVRCQQLLVHDRCREDTYRTLMLCHARLGQRDRVRCWYELCVRTLRSELGVEPEAETVALYRRAILSNGLTTS